MFNVQMSGFENLPVPQAGVQMKLYTIYGECIYQHICTSANQQIDISSSPKGIYFIKVISGENIYTDKIAVQ